MEYAHSEPHRFHTHDKRIEETMKRRSVMKTKTLTVLRFSIISIMKSTASIFLFSLLLAASAWSQTASDSARVTTQKKSAQVFLDEDGNGVDDEQESGKRMKRHNDLFIDRDSDGICDGRENGFRIRSSYKNTGRESCGGKK